MAHICVIDDNTLILKSIELALTKVGHIVTTMDNIESFIKLIEEQDFDLIISDYFLKGHSIHEILDTATKKIPSVRFLIMSGKIPEGIGDIPFIQKPFRIAELRKKVAFILRGEV